MAESREQVSAVARRLHSRRAMRLPRQDEHAAVASDIAASAPTEEFVQLFTRHQRRLYLYILSQVPNIADAEEILQDANCVMLAKHGQFQAGTNFGAWATQIVVYEILQYRQRFGREKLRFSEEFLQTVAEELPESLDQLEDRRQALESCLQKLRPGDRQLIQERYRPGSRACDVADKLGRPANSVYQSLGRIRRMLMECIQRQLATEG